MRRMLLLIIFFNTLSPAQPVIRNNLQQEHEENPKVIYQKSLSNITYESTAKWFKMKGPGGGGVATISSKGDTLVVSCSDLLYSNKVFYSKDSGLTWSGSEKRYPDYFIAFTFSTNNYIYAAARGSGIYRSSNFISWEQIFDNGEEYYGIIADKFGNLFAGTESGKIFKSTNEGKDWFLDFESGINRIQKFILTGDTIYVGSSNRILRKEPGKTWEIMEVGLGSQFYYPFLDNSLTLYAYGISYIFKRVDTEWLQLDTNFFFRGNYIYDMKVNNRMIAACGDESSWFGNAGGIALSEDMGLTWFWRNIGLPPKFSSAGTLLKSNQNTYLTTNAAGVFKSTNFGDSWFPVNNGITAAITLDICLSDTGTIYAANWSNGFQKSTDNGNTWLVINNGLTNSYCYSIVEDDNGILLGGTEEGTFRSTDKGENWIRTAPPGNDFAYSLLKDKLNRIYALTYGSGIRRTTDMGNTWTRIDNGFISPFTFGFAIDESGNIYAGTRQGAVYKSTNDGASWAIIYMSPNSSAIINGICISPNGNIFVSSINEGILRSTDNGQTWVKKTNGFNTLKFRTLAINSKGEIFTATNKEGIYFSNDNGETWQNITENMALTEVNEIIVDNLDNLYLATDESVWRTNPDAIPVELTAFSASVGDNDVYLSWTTATELNNRGFELYKGKRKKLKGKSEEEKGKSGDEISSEDWALVAFVEGGGTTGEMSEYSYVDNDVESGVYQYKLVQIDYDGTRSEEKIVEVEVNTVPNQFALFQNYPNPFNPTTTIKFSIPADQFVSVKVYNLLGKEAARLVNKNLKAGIHEVIFNASGLSSGMYFYKIEAGSFTAVRKMTLLK